MVFQCDLDMFSHGVPVKLNTEAEETRLNSGVEFPKNWFQWVDRLGKAALLAAI